MDIPSDLTTPHDYHILSEALTRALQSPSTKQKKIHKKTKKKIYEEFHVKIPGKSNYEYWEITEVHQDKASIKAYGIPDQDTSNQSFVCLTRTPITIEHHFALRKYKFNSPADFISHIRKGQHLLDYHHDTIAQWAFNKKNLLRSGRITALKKAVLIAKTERSPTISVQSFLPSKKWLLRHPDYSKSLISWEYVLNSLVETKELEKANGNKYNITPRALITLDKYIQETRRHRNQIGFQILLGILSAAIAILAAFIGRLK
ncbi:hypothetical protein ACOTFH_22010 [Achromobacter xylosoxidans]|uniref:hypothetical protein n=1 Tax=Achromobacter ruhlandii TaxID=72557 RepID=UPI001466F83B|nr:hypothetical protein [Achromobacter ruhlandii]CAB3737200.1 hypothetical protein LMG1866_05180 [Achromobacter ruhlandii]